MYRVRNSEIGGVVIGSGMVEPALNRGPRLRIREREREAAEINTRIRNDTREPRSSRKETRSSGLDLRLRDRLPEVELRREERRRARASESRGFPQGDQSVDFFFFFFSSTTAR